eukprot:COSAG02_NODE_830_length_16689_cov_10.438999_1_plen_69_part_10
MTLQPSKPGIPQEALPYIHFLPAENFTPPESDYQCPLYRTNIRAGVLSTTVRIPPTFGIPPPPPPPPPP